MWAFNINTVLLNNNYQKVDFIKKKTQHFFKIIIIVNVKINF